MDKQEKIVCAAINIITAKEGNFILEEVFCGVDYQSIENTNIFKTYCDALNVISRTDGFITSKNRFVDAKEAWEIAENAEQINYDIIDYSCYEEKGYQELKPSDLY